MLIWLLAAVLLAGAVIVIKGVVTKSKLKSVMTDRGIKRAVVEMADNVTNVVKLKDLDDDTTLEIRSEEGVSDEISVGEVIVINDAGAPQFDVKELLRGLDYSRSEEAAIIALQRLENDTSPSPVRTRYIEEMKARLEVFDKQARTVICGEKEFLLESREEAEKARNMPEVPALDVSWNKYRTDPEEWKSLSVLLENSSIPRQIRESYQRQVCEFRAMRKNDYDSYTTAIHYIISQGVIFIAFVILGIPLLSLAVRHWDQWNWYWGLKTRYFGVLLFILGAVWPDTDSADTSEVSAIVILFMISMAMPPFASYVSSNNILTWGMALPTFFMLISVGILLGAIKNGLCVYRELRKERRYAKRYLISSFNNELGNVEHRPLALGIFSVAARIIFGVLKVIVLYFIFELIEATAPHYINSDYEELLTLLGYAAKYLLYALVVRKEILNLFLLDGKQSVAVHM